MILWHTFSLIFFSNILRILTKNLKIWCVPIRIYFEWTKNCKKKRNLRQKVQFKFFKFQEKFWRLWHPCSPKFWNVWKITFCCNLCFFSDHISFIWNIFIWIFIKIIFFPLYPRVLKKLIFSWFFLTIRNSCPIFFYWLIFWGLGESF